MPPKRRKAGPSLCFLWPFTTVDKLHVHRKSSSVDGRQKAFVRLANLWRAIQILYDPSAYMSRTHKIWLVLSSWIDFRPFILDRFELIFWSTKDNLTLVFSMFGLFHAHQLYLPSQTQRPIFTCQGQTWSDLLSFIFRKTLCGSPAWKMSLFVSIASFAKISMDLALDLSKSVLFWTTCWNNLYKILPVVHSTLVPVEKKDPFCLKSK